MKKILSIAFFALFTTFASAQTPDKMSYQAIVRNSSSELLTNQSVGIRLNIVQGSADGTTIYTEVHNVTSNGNGLITLEFGEGTSSLGSFNEINWANGPYFIKTETDISGGTNYTITGTSQMLSVPYALYAKTSGSSTPGPQGSQGEIGLTGPAGPQGIQGEAGTIGLTGPQGPQGEVGPAGPTGPQGIQGEAGAIGLTGSQGPQGETGLTGPAGPQGIQGEAGAIGLTGPQGPQGEIGLTGPAGPQGIQGETGAIGLTGPQGPQGEAGPTGPQGPAGFTGSQGPQGQPGVAGPIGPQGPQGEAGPTGPQGEQGLQGGAGPTGLQGPIGFTGPQGPQGPQGEPGLAGPTGPQGPQGEVGPVGPTGPQGEPGLAGPTGLQGPQGEAGPTGMAGAGVPTGGTAGQVLAKVDGTDYNTQWVNTSSGGVGAKLQLFAKSTNAQTIRPFAYNRYTFNFNQVVAGESTSAWTSSNTYTIPQGEGGLYNINFTLVETDYGGFTNPVIIFPEIQVTSGGNVSYYYGTGGSGSVLLQGNGTDLTTIGAPGVPRSYVRSSGNFTVPFQAGDIIKVFYRTGASSNCTSCTVSFSTDGSTYLSIIKL